MSQFEDEVSTESGSDRVTILAISILAIGGDPVASTTPRGLPAWGPRSALGTDFITIVLQIMALPFAPECLVISLEDSGR